MRALAILLLLLTPVVARGDGGTVRASERSGPYRISVFTTPTPLRAGAVDVSVLVQDDRTGQSLPEANVSIRASSRDLPGEEFILPATTAAATNKLLQAAALELDAGRWTIQADVDGPAGRGSVAFDVEVGEPLPRWTEMVFWIALPVLPIALYLLCQMSVKNRKV